MSYVAYITPSIGDGAFCRNREDTDNEMISRSLLDCGNGICYNNTYCICDEGYIWDLSNSITRNCYMKDTTLIYVISLLSSLSLAVFVYGMIKYLYLTKNYQANNIYFAKRVILCNAIGALNTFLFTITHYFEEVIGPFTSVFYWLTGCFTCISLYYLIVGIMAPIHETLNASTVDFQRRMRIVSVAIVLPVSGWFF